MVLQRNTISIRNDIKNETFYVIILCMESGENLNTDINNDNTDFETANGWESLMDDESESMAAFAAHALQKAKARDRIEQDQKHSEPETPYRQRRKKIEQNLGHVGTSILDVLDKTTDRQAIRQELLDYGVDSIDELDNIEHFYEQILSPEQVFEKFNGLFTFLGEDTKGNPNVIEEYQQITDKKEQLRFILSSSLSDKVRLFCSENFDYPNYDNFMHRLQFQQDFINGTAKVWRQEWDVHKGKYIDVQRPLDSSDANADDILLGLNRASLRSAMVGTPEYGAYKMAMDIMRGRDWSMTPDFPEISGYWSGITNASIGSWETIIDEYDAIASKVARRNPDMDEESLEHITVRKAARIFADSMEYNDTGRGPESPYVSSFHESVVWTQLGYGVQRQLRGMRQRIMNSDLHNIERFIGKSGYSYKRGSFESERSRLSNRIDYIDGLSDDDKQEFLAKENAFEIKKQEEWREKEVERIKHKYERLISKTRSEERRATYASRQEEEIQRVMADTSGRIEYFESRTLDRLFSDINERRELLSRRIEKRKSLAEKAIELHFKLGNGHDEWDDDIEEYVRIGGSQYQECLDWINDAPFGAIKRAHRRMVDGMPADEIYKLAISETIRKAVNNPDQADIAMHQMFRDVEDGSGSKYKIREIMRLAGKLSKYSEELSYSELESMSDKDTRWIEDSLAAFPFSDVKQFIDKGLNLSLVPKLSSIAEEFGYELDTNQLIELSSKGVIKSYNYKEVEGVFTSTLRNFSLDEAMTAMDADVDLRILNAAKSILSTQGISDFSEILDRATKIGQFSDGYGGGYEEFISQYRTAINSIGIEKADDLLSRGVDLDTFNMTTREFRDSVGDDFNKALRLSEKISIAMQRSRDLDQEETSIRALYNSDAGHTESQIISLYEHGITASVYEDVFVYVEHDGDNPGVKEKSGLEFSDKVKLLQNALRDNPDSWRIKEAIESFDDDMLHQLAERGADVVHASRVKYLLGRDEKYSEFNTPENVLYLASNNLEVDVFLRAADAGFSVDEIKLYPFLASDLLIKERNE